MKISSRNNLSVPGQRPLDDAPPAGEGWRGSQNGPGPDDRAPAAHRTPASFELAHGRTHWLHLATAVATEDPPGQLAALHAAWVRRPLSDGPLLHSCGMHLLGLPDIECPRGDSERESVALLDSLALRTLALPVPRSETRLVHQGRTLEIQHVECARYGDDDFHFNPYGCIRVVSQSTLASLR